MTKRRVEFDLIEGPRFLSRTPAVLRALLGSLPDEWVHANEGPDTWSPFDVVGHLINGDESDWMVRARTIVSGSKEPFAPFDRFRHLEENRGRSLGELLEEFELVRTRNVSDLESMALSPADLALSGTHPAFGSVTLGQLLATWVTHDLSHLTQITRTLAKANREAVGPWAEYLSVLSR